DRYARLIVLRLSAQRHRIAVGLDDAAWDHLVQSRSSRTLAKTSDPFRAAASSDVLVCTPEQLGALNLTRDTPAVIVVSNTKPPITPAYSLIASHGLAELHTPASDKGGDNIAVKTDSSPSENYWLV